MLAVKTIIGYGAKRAGTGPAHGGPYGAEEVATVREAIGWPHAPFDVPAEIETAWAEAGKRAAGDYAAWQDRLSASGDKAAFEAAMAGALPANLSDVVNAHKKAVVEGGEDKATRQWSGAALEPLTAAIPEMIGGSADLTGSNNTKTSHTAPLSPDNWAGRYVHYGVREHAMAAAMKEAAVTTPITTRHSAPPAQATRCGAPDPSVSAATRTPTRRPRSFSPQPTAIFIPGG